MMQHDYVTLKLVNGDNLISVLVNEDDSKYVLMYPIQMKTVNYNLDGKSKEVLAGSPWCSFTDHQVFKIWKEDVIIIKPLNESTLDYYKRMIDVQIESEQLDEIVEEELYNDIKVSNETIH